MLVCLPLWSMVEVSVGRQIEPITTHIPTKCEGLDLRLCHCTDIESIARSFCPAVLNYVPVPSYLEFLDPGVEWGPSG